MDILEYASINKMKKKERVSYWLPFVARSEGERARGRGRLAGNRMELSVAGFRGNPCSSEGVEECVQSGDDSVNNQGTTRYVWYKDDTRERVRG